MKHLCLLFTIVAAGGLALANAPVLTWAPQGAAVWDKSSVNWLDGQAPSAWVAGAIANFDGPGGAVDVQEEVEVGGITFTSGDYDLAGKALTFAASARIDVQDGSSTIRNALDGLALLNIAVQGGSLALEGSAVTLPKLEQGALSKRPAAARSPSGAAR